MGAEFLKSAFEKAWERAEKISIPDEKIKELELLSEGEKLAAAFLKDENFDLLGELSKFDASSQRIIIKGAENTFLKNIVLPQTLGMQKGCERALEGIKLLKRDKVSIENLVEEIKNLFLYYQEAVKQAHAKLRKEFEIQITRALQEQLGTPVKVKATDIEQNPEFREKWHQVLRNINAEYEKILDQHKKEITNIM